MSAIAIYMEGGGPQAGGQSALRVGMEQFLREFKNAALSKGWEWKLVVCGDRVQARKAFLAARAHDSARHVFLLVDSEGPVTTDHAREHLQRRDGWAFPGIGDDALQLMAQVMETWLVADPDALEKYYGQGFKPKALPAATDLETVDKKTVLEALTHATKDTQKGRYHKIKHARELLARIEPRKAQARCRHCRRLFERLAFVLREA